MPGENDVLLSEQQVSELLQLHVQTVRNRRRDGTGPKVTWVGRYPRYWRSDVLIDEDPGDEQAQQRRDEEHDDLGPDDEPLWERWERWGW